MVEMRGPTPIGDRRVGCLGMVGWAPRLRLGMRTAADTGLARAVLAWHRRYFAPRRATCPRVCPHGVLLSPGRFHFRRAACLVSLRSTLGQT
eukprot:5882506-Prymnesium_polylepis.1